MNIKQRTRLNMFLGVRNYGIQNKKITDTIAEFSPIFASFQNTIDEIQLFGEMQGINKTGLTIDKNKLKRSVITLTVKYSNKIAILAKLSNNDTLLKEVRLNESNLVKLPGVTMKERAQNIYDRAEENIDNLEEQGVTPDTQKVFLETITAFNNALSTPRTGIAQKKEATQKLPVLFATADSLVEIMDLAVGSVKDEQPDFYNGYKASRKLVGTNSGSIALRASAKEIVSGEPVHGALFTFNHDEDRYSESAGNGEITKKTSMKGRFYIKNMKSGTYKVVISKPGYKDKETSVSVADGERSELNVELEKV